MVFRESLGAADIVVSEVAGPECAPSDRTRFGRCAAESVAQRPESRIRRRRARRRGDIRCMHTRPGICKCLRYTHRRDRRGVLRLRRPPLGRYSCEHQAPDRAILSKSSAIRTLKAFQFSSASTSARRRATQKCVRISRITSCLAMRIEHEAAAGRVVASLKPLGAKSQVQMPACYSKVGTMRVLMRIKHDACLHPTPHGNVGVTLGYRRIRAGSSSGAGSCARRKNKTFRSVRRYRVCSLRTMRPGSLESPQEVLWGCRRIEFRSHAPCPSVRRLKTSHVARFNPHLSASQRPIAPCA